MQIEISKRILNFILIGIGVILIVLLWIAFKQTKVTHEQELREELIEVLKEKNALSDTIISLRERTIEINNKKQELLIQSYEKIADRIDGMDREQLRRELSKYE